MDQTGASRHWFLQSNLFWRRMNYYGLIREGCQRFKISWQCPQIRQATCNWGFPHKKLLLSRFLQSSLLAFLIISEFPQTAVFGTEIGFHMISVWKKGNFLFFFLHSKIPSNPLKLRVDDKQIQVCYSYIKKRAENPLLGQLTECVLCATQF